MNRLRSLRPLLASIDLVKAEPPAGLASAIDELEKIRQALTAVRPTGPRAATHEMILRSCALAQTATKLRNSASDPATVRNAGSAAAGALLLLDRVCIELGCEPLPGVR